MDFLYYVANNFHELDGNKKFSLVPGLSNEQRSELKYLRGEQVLLVDDFVPTLVFLAVGEDDSVLHQTE